MEEQLIEKKLAELVAVLHGDVGISEPPCTPFIPQKGTSERACFRPVVPKADALDWLRLRVRYLLFDLEATRRENAYLKRLIQCEDRE